MTLRLALAQLLLLLGSFSLQAESFPRNTDSFINHLQFLGYTCEKTDNLILAKHKSHWHFSFGEARGGIFFRALFNIKPKYYNDPALNKAIIKVMEENIWLTQIYPFRTEAGELILFVYTWIPDYYNRDHFSEFMNRWEDDVAMAVEKLREFIKFGD